MTSTPPQEPSQQPPREPEQSAATSEVGASPPSESPAAEPQPAPPQVAPPQVAPPQPAPPQPAPPYAAAQGPVPFDQTAPFAPVVREPRVPWINPDRRSHLLGAALIGALLVLGAGFGIGYAVAPSDHDRNGPQRFERGGPNFQGPPGQLAPGRQRGQFPGGGNGYGQRNGPGGVQPAPSSSGATPAPSTTG